MCVDGYTSLLIEEEGGVAKELVSEENGVLISTILRQYFMSLRVLGKWKRWGKSMNSKFLSIQTNLQNNHNHTFHDPSPTSKTSSQPRPHPSIDRIVNQRDAPSSGSDTEDQEDDEYENDGPMYDSRVPIQFNDRQIDVIRRVTKKWRRLAGLQGAPDTVDELSVSEFQVNWTKAIAPRLEGRITEVGIGAKTNAL